LGWLAPVLVGVLILVGVQAPAAETKKQDDIQASEARMRQDITFLASDECEGRGPATKGLDLAADYIANEFKKAGLKPAGKDGSYFQPFTMRGAKLEGPPSLVLHGPKGVAITLKPGSHYNALGLSHAGNLTAAPLVFAGYGITSDKNLKQPAIPEYDDYKDLDVEGKIVILLRETPRADNKFALDPQWKNRHGGLITKLDNARKHRAAAVIFVNSRGMAEPGDDMMDFNFHATAVNNVKLPILQIRRALLQSLLFSAAGADLQDVEAGIDRELKPRSAALDGWTADLEVKVQRSEKLLPLKNIIGYLEGHGKLANEIIVVGAHYDHVGYGGSYSAARVTKPTIHHGADDNGSGSTAIMELARRFAKMPNREGRKLVFMTFSGEEQGLLGSAYYCKEPIFPLADTAAMVNLDMVGRLRLEKAVPGDPVTKIRREELLTEGTGSSKEFSALLDTLNKKHNFKLKKEPKVIPYSDHASFYGKKVPVIFFWTGYHPDYHRPSDTSDKINVAGMRRVVDMTEDLINHLATVAERPKYVKMTSGGGSPGVPSIGIDAADDNEKGVLVKGVTEGGPAVKAGIKSGDRIIEIAGKPVKNLQAYMTTMSAQKPGDMIELTLMRGDKKLSVKVTPANSPVPRIGIRPSYGDESDKGLLVDGVTEGGPAAKAGIKTNDRIIEIAGKPVTNLETYMTAMGAQKRGVEVEMTLLRGDKKVKVKVKPE
jgi:hypothetical protein